MIDLNNIPVEPTITIVDPNGNDVITTNNVTTLFYIRSEIKKNSLKGYKVRTDGGELWDIKSNGKIDTWSDNMTGSVFDKLLADLI
jgi:hypothetical protein